MYDPAVYAQLPWPLRLGKLYLTKGEGEQLSKVLQGPPASYSEFVDHLLQLKRHILGDVDLAMTVIKQLAYENANKYCQEAICPL